MRWAAPLALAVFSATTRAWGQPPPPPPPAASGGPIFRAAPDTAPPVTPPPSPSPTPPLDARLGYARGPGADACPDEQGFHDAVAANIGHDPFTAASPRLATVMIASERGAFVGRMELRDAAGALVWAPEPLKHIDCRDLVRIMGLAFAVKIDPFPARPLPTPVVVAAPAVLPPLPLPAPPAADARQAPPPTPPAPRPKVRIGLRAGVALGTEPTATGGFGVQLGVRWPLASLSAEGRADVPVSGGGNLIPMTHVAAGLFAGSLVPCGHVPLPARFNIPVCGILTLGAIRGAGLSVDVPQSGAGVYAAAGGRTGLEIPVNDAGSIALRVEGDLVGVVKPVTITLNGQDVWTTGRVNGGVGGGVRLDL